MKKFLALATLISGSAFAQKMPQGVFSELAKFPGLSPAYIQQLPVTINQILNANEQNYHKNIKAVCTPKINVQYINQITQGNDSVVKDFESGFIGIEATLCFTNTKIDKVISLYTNREFQAQSVSTIKGSYQNGNLICEKTSAPTIGNSHYCYEQQAFADPTYILNYAFNVWNDSVQNANAPVYFRDVMATATQVQNNVEFHLQTYVRGPKLNFFQKAFAKGAISNEQQSLYEKMKVRLK